MVACRYTSASAAAELSSKPEKFAMFTRWLTFLGCLACATYLAAEAMPRPARSAIAPPSLPTEPAADARRQPGFEPSNRDGRDLLDRAMRKLNNITWLRVTVWQRMHG